VTGGADFGRKDLKDFESQAWFGMHEGVEVVMGDETELGAVAGERAEGIRLVADEARESEERAGSNLHGKKRISRSRFHGECDFALVEDEEAQGRFTLAEEVVFAATGDVNGMLSKGIDQLRIGEEC
jgi:hypothetical protein